MRPGSLEHYDLYQSARGVRSSAIEAKEKARLLSAVDLLEPLSQGEVEEFSRRLPMVRFEKGQKLYTPAYTGKIFFLLLRGRVRIYRVARKQEITLALVGAGEVFGEAAFVPRELPGAYAEAMERSDVALMSLGFFERLVGDKPGVGLKAMELLCERLSFYEDRLVDIGVKEVLARLAGLILHLVEREGVVVRGGYRILTHYTREQMGTMIGAKRVAVTRALGELRKAGVVESEGRGLYVLDLEALKRAATN